MTNDPQDQIDRLFSEALRRPEDRRAAFLEEHCAEADVRRKVRSLLEDYEAAADLFDGLADAAVAPMLSTLQGRGDPEGGSRGADPLDLEGTQVGRYQVERHLGGGGMGVVYRARDPELSREVALKFLPPVLATSPEAEERFVREARAAAALGHSSIATIHEIGTTEAGRRFIAMAYYEGETLKEKLDREGALPVEKALGYAEQIAEALARAHEAGIVHRDVKPANVMVTAAGDVKLLDFGLAKAAAETRLTETGRRMGTAAYMSPEQAEGQAIDGRTDVWALGVVLYEMLAGERPFRGERKTAVIHSILHEEPDPLREHRSEIPPALKKIVGGCLQKDPNERYSSAEGLAEDLRAVRSDAEAVSVNAPSFSEPSTDSSSRRWLAGGAAILLLALALSAGWALWPDDPAPEAPPSAGPSEPSVAVLPFRSSGKNSPAGAFATGIHGDLLTRLSGISDLQVIPRSSVQGYRGVEEPVRRAARELGAEWVLEGDVQTTGEQVQVRARLVNAEDVRQVWADRYRRALTAENLFEIQTDITRKIARALEVNLSPDERARTGRQLTESTAAYELYVQARRTTYNDRQTEEELTLAMDLYRRAVALDSTFAEAWAGLADLYAARSWETDSNAWADSGLVAARRAIAHDPELADAYVQLGDNLGALGRTDEQIAAYRSALARRPDHPQALNNLCVVLGRQGRLADVMQALDRAYRAAPEAPSVLAKLAAYNAGLGRAETADAWLNIGRRQGPATEHSIHFLRIEFGIFLRRGELDRARETLRTLSERENYPLHLRRAVLAVHEGTLKEARRHFRQLVHEYGVGWVSGTGEAGFLSAGPGLAWTLRRLGRAEEARSVARRALGAIDRSGDTGSPQMTARASAHLVLGDTTAAMEELERAVEAGFRGANVLETSPVLAPLRERSRFEALRKRVERLLAKERRRVEANGWGERN